MAFTKQELEAMYLADAEIERDFAMTLDEFKNANERDGEANEERLDNRKRRKREYMKRYRAENKEKLNAQSLDYYYAHKERCQETSNKWKAKNVEYCAAYDKAYDAEHRELRALQKQLRMQVNRALERLLSEG